MLGDFAYGNIVYICCGMVLMMSTVAPSQDSDYMNNEIRRRREWTEWFNTDTSTSGTGDDESLASIRKRGFSVCDGSTPIDAVCRIAADPSVVFNVGTTDFTDDKLVIPCTSIGIVCRNKDQGLNNTCEDYAIRFQCQSVSEQVEQVGNLGMIGIAAGLSVIIPIICVTCMHVTRIIKERSLRRHAESDEDESSGGQCESFVGDLPPSYSDLFGNANGSMEQLLTGMSSSSNFMSIVEENNDVNRRSDSFSDDRDTGSVIYSIPNSPRFSRSLSIHSAGAQISIMPQSCRRIPGMHLSIFDLMFAQEESNSNSPDTNDQSYIQTPPPSYNEAIVILGGFPFKHTAISNNVYNTSLPKANEAKGTTQLYFGS